MEVAMVVALRHVNKDNRQIDAIMWTQVNEALVSNIRKWHSDEHQNDAFLKKSRVCGNEYQSVEQRLSRQRLSDDDDDNDDDEDMEDLTNFENELSRNDETADANNKAPAQKPKRGRKMTMTTKYTYAMCTTIEKSTTISSDNAQLSFSAKKKKRSRKSVTNQSRQGSNSKDDGRNLETASISDENEECSFARQVKIRPTGREVDWMQCDGGCNEWFHMLCVGLVKNQMKPDDEFICKKCKSKRQILSPKQQHPQQIIQQRRVVLSRKLSTK